MKYITNLSDFYKTNEWVNLRKLLMLERVNEDGELICTCCGKPILKKYDCIAHHKEELTLENVNDVNISLNPNNIDLIHRKCHDEIHQRFGYYKPKVILVHGNICSGKSSYVKQIATKDDLILDMDNLWQAVSINPRYVKPNRLKPIVFALRQCLLEQIKIRNGMPFNYYIISTEPFVLARKRLIDMLGIDEVIWIDTNVEKCLQNLYNDDSRKNVLEEYEKYILNYEKNFQPD